MGFKHATERREIKRETEFCRMITEDRESGKFPDRRLWSYWSNGNQRRNEEELLKFLVGKATYHHVILVDAAMEVGEECGRNLTPCCSLNYPPITHTERERGGAVRDIISPLPSSSLTGSYEFHPHRGTEHSKQSMKYFQNHRDSISHPKQSPEAKTSLPATVTKNSRGREREGDYISLSVC